MAAEANDSHLRLDIEDVFSLQHNKLLIGIDGMTCSSCISTVANCLEKLPSVENVVVSLATNSATLEYNRARIKSSQIAKEVEDIGYDVQIMSDVSPSPQKKTSTVKKVVLGIEGMTCTSCSSTVHSALSGIPGVTNVVVSLTTNSATFNYDPVQTNTKDIINEVESNGFDARVLNESSVNTGGKPHKMHTKLLLGIEGMTCSSCTSTVESALNSIPSVRNVIVTLATNTATLEFDPEITTSKNIIEEIEGNGFDATIMKETPIPALLTQKTTITTMKLDILGPNGPAEFVGILTKMPSIRKFEMNPENNSFMIEFDSLATPSKTMLASLQSKLTKQISLSVLEENTRNEEIILTNQGNDNDDVENNEELHIKSILLNILNPSISLDRLHNYQFALEKLEGIQSISFNEEDRHFIISFNDLFIGPRNILAIGKYTQTIKDSTEIQFAAMGGFMMANRLLKLQQKELKELQFLFFLSLILTIPIVLLGMILPLHPDTMMSISNDVTPGLTISDFIQLILATPIQFYVGWKFHKKAVTSLKTKTFGMDFMISTGTFAAYIYSVITLVRNMVAMKDGGMSDTYFDTSAVLITAILFGKYLEIYARGQTTSAIHKLSNLRANNARLVGTMPNEQLLAAPSSYLPLMKDDFEAVKEDEEHPSLSSVADGGDKNVNEILIDASVLHKFDVIRLVTGETIPADGILLSGSRIAVDESLLTGESRMIPKKEFEIVHGGSTVVEGSALMRVIGVGDDSTLGKIIKTVQEAQVSKPEIQEMADRFAKYFVPIVMGISIGAFIIWIILAESGILPMEWIDHAGGSFLFAFTFGLAVWVSACPCAFGLATPTAILVATGVAAKYGVLIRRGAAFQTAAEVDTICFDKTGTLTRGCTEVSDFFYIPDDDEKKSGGLDHMLLLPLYDDLDNNNNHNGGGDEKNHSKKEKNPEELLLQKQQQDQEIYDFFYSLLFSPSSPSSSSIGVDTTNSKHHLFHELYYTLQILLSTEVRSNHPLAKGITAYCKKMLQMMENPIFMKEYYNLYPKNQLNLPKEDELLFDIVPGQGVHMYTNPSSNGQGQQQPIHVLVGNAKLLASQKISLPKVIQDISKGFTSSGKVAIYFAMNNRLTGILSISDKVRPETTYILHELIHKRNIACYMVTGDSLSTALAIGSSIGLPKENILAEVKPEEKELFVAALQSKGRRVAFIGDGTNDSPALSRAHVGLTMAASGSDIAIEAGDILLYKNSLSTILISLDLASKTFRRIKLNYLWAFGYNICLIPIAAGLFYPFFQFALQPMYAGAVMAISSVSIVVSSLTIALYSPHHYVPSPSKSSNNKHKNKNKKKQQGDVVYDELQQHHDDHENHADSCHCPVSNITTYEEEKTSLLPNSPKLFRTLSKTLSQQIHFFDDLEGNHKKKKITAYEILHEYKLAHPELTPLSSQPLTIGPTFSKKNHDEDEADEEDDEEDDEESKLRPMEIVTRDDLLLFDGTTAAGTGEDSKCSCAATNCKCAGFCKCGLRKRT